MEGGASGGLTPQSLRDSSVDWLANRCSGEPCKVLNYLNGILNASPERGGGPPKAVERLKGAMQKSEKGVIKPPFSRSQLVEYTLKGSDCNGRQPHHRAAVCKR